jgi:hypothetical protein
MLQLITKRLISKLRAIRIRARTNRLIRVRILTRVIMHLTRLGRGDQNIFKGFTSSVKEIRSGVRLITIRLSSSRQISKGKRKT